MNLTFSGEDMVVEGEAEVEGVFGSRLTVVITEKETGKLVKTIHFS